jgi:sulfide:quinone oxidoreductase
MDLKWLGSSLAVRGQIGVSDIPALKALGFRLIINNRPDGEDSDQPLSDQIAKAAALADIGYAYVPVAKTGPTPHDAVEFARAFHDAGGKTLAFCRTGNRSEAIWRLIGEMQTTTKRR